MLPLRIKAFPTFRSLCGTTIYPSFRNSRLKTNQVSGDQSNEQTPSFEISTQLPDVLRQQCKNWMRALWAEQKAKEAKQKWKNSELKCTNVSTTPNTSELTMSVENLTNEAKQVFMRYFTSNSPVLLRPFVKCPWQEDIVGFLAKHIYDANGQLSASTIYVKRRFSRDEQEQIKNTLFDIKLTNESGTYKEFTTWLKRNDEWVRMPGFNAMLYSFKCKPWPTNDEISNDSTDWDSFDQSQLAALCAVQNLNWPIVAVHGPPGTGKTMLLVRHLQKLKKQKEKACLLYKLKHHTQIYEMQAKILMMVRRRRFAEERRKNYPE